jgi:epoxyqueuosine reductase
MEPRRLAEAILAVSRELGFHRLGVIPVEPAARHELYRSWIDRGYAGELGYLTSAADVESRRDPRRLLAEARTIVCVALSYARPEPPAPGGGGPRGFVARYARGEDYHLVLKQKLAALAARVAEVAGRQVAYRACVDTAPLLERDAAERAGLGFVAKNTMLIAPGLGSYVLLGELLLDVDVAPTAPDPGDTRRRCGTCRACLDACPTGAFVDAYLLDARRCISYLTIELVGPIPRELRPLVGTRVFGCDVCQEVCPFNATTPPPADPELSDRRVPGAPDLIELLRLGANQHRRLVRRTALRRISRHLLLRNVCVALGNAGDPAAIAPLRETFASPQTAPIVRAHAAWALGRLGDHAFLRGARGRETDPDVIAELDAAISGPAAASSAP